MDEISRAVQKSGTTTEDVPKTSGYSSEQLKENFPSTTDPLLLEKINSSRLFEQTTESNLEEFDVSKNNIDNALREVGNQTSNQESTQQLVEITNEKIIETIDIEKQIKQLENSIRETTKQNIKTALDIYTYPMTPMQQEVWVSDKAKKPRKVGRPEVSELPLK